MRAVLATLGLSVLCACLPFRDPAVVSYRCASGTTLFVRGSDDGSGVSLFLDEREIPLLAVAHRPGQFSNGNMSLWLTTGRATLEIGGRPAHVDCRARPTH